MAMTKTLAQALLEDPVFRNFRSLSVGFDPFFEKVLASNEKSGYPPYNLLETGPGYYQIEVALAGFKKTDVSVTIEDGSLCIFNRKESPPNIDCDNKRYENGEDGKCCSIANVDYIHRGISKRNFRLAFKIAEQVEIQSATMEDGILTVKLFHRVKSPPAVKQITIE